MPRRGPTLSVARSSRTATRALHRFRPAAVCHVPAPFGGAGPAWKVAMISRRQFIAAGAATGAALIVPWRLLHHGARAAALDGGPSLDPHTITKYAQPLAVLPAMPSDGTVEHGSVDNYVIGV